MAFLGATAPFWLVETTEWAGLEMDRNARRHHEGRVRLKGAVFTACPPWQAQDSTCASDCIQYIQVWKPSKVRYPLSTTLLKVPAGVCDEGNRDASR